MAGNYMVYVCHDGLDPHPHGPMVKALAIALARAEFARWSDSSIFQRVVVQGDSPTEALRLVNPDYIQPK